MSSTVPSSRTMLLSKPLMARSRVSTRSLLDSRLVNLKFRRRPKSSRYSLTTPRSLESSLPLRSRMAIPCIPRGRLASRLRQLRRPILRNSGSQSMARRSRPTIKLRPLNMWTRVLTRMSLERKMRTTSTRKRTLGLKTMKKTPLTRILTLPIRARSLQMPRPTQAISNLAKKTALK